MADTELDTKLRASVLEAKRRQLEADARKLEADARKLEAQARAAENEAEISRIDRDFALLKEREVLANDHYHHVYRFTNAVSEGTVAHCIGQLTLWHRLNPGCSIEVIFSSPGGAVIPGMALYDFLCELRMWGHHLTTVGRGYAASMAGVLLQAGDHRVLGPQSYLLIHEISTFAIGKIGEIEDTVEFVKKIQRRVLDIFAARSKKSAVYYEKRWKRKDWWVDSKEALELGLVDEVR